jgi:hypothetical protein
VQPARGPARGIVLLVAAGLAVWRGWQIHTGRMALFAYGLAAAALALAFWHFTRKADKLRNGPQS